MSEMHYSLEEWSDFARNRASAESAARMQRHLDEGCDACSQMLEMWRSVLEVAGREAAFHVPESGVQSAKELYRIARPERPDSLPVRLARLVFSSAGEPLREGVRGAAAATTHLLYEEGDYLLDLHMKPEVVRSLVSLAGQILDRAHPDQAYENSIVAILRRDEELARTTTNEFGEFQMEFSSGGNVMLTINLQGEAVLVSVLPGPSESRH
jgi:hypothetical protein